MPDFNEHDRRAAEIVRRAFEPKSLNGHGKLRHSLIGLAAASVAAAVLQTPQELREKQEAHAALLEEAQNRVAVHQDALVRLLVRQRYERGELPSPDLEAIAGGMELTDYEDGLREIHVDGRLLVSFWPPAVGFDEKDGGMLVQMAYKVAP